MVSLSNDGVNQSYTAAKNQFSMVEKLLLLNVNATLPPHSKNKKKTPKVLNMLPAGDLRDRDTLGAGLCIHVALVIICHSVRRTREVGLSLTAVSALADRLPVPDVTLGPLLRAHELVAGGPLRHPDGALVALDVYVARCHAALVATHVRAALFKCLAVLKEEKKPNLHHIFYRTNSVESHVET